MEDDAVDMASENSLPLGIGASAFGSEHGDEEDDVIPQRSLPFALGHSGHVGQIVERAESPPSSYGSMHSDGWLETMEDHEPTSTKVQLFRQDSSSSSNNPFDSDEDINVERNEEGNTEESTRKRSKSKDESQKQKQSAPAPVKPELFVDPNEKRHPALTVAFAFNALTSCLKKLAQEEIKRFKKLLWERYPERFREQIDGSDIVDVVDKMLELCDIEVSLKITLALLKDMNFKKLAEYLQGLIKRNEVRYDLKLTLKRKYEMVHEGFAQQGQPVQFDSVFTELYISDGINAAVNSEHEVRAKIEELAESGKVKREALSLKDVLAHETLKSKHVRSVLAKGVPGSGKSFAVQQFILDWAIGEIHQDIFFLLPLPFRELNQMQEGEYTFMSLISTLYPEMKEVDTLDFEGCPVMFVCDGLDDFQITLDFRRTVYWCDVNRPASVQVLITNLIRGNLLYNAFVWVISRPGALDVIPPEHVHQLLEVRGFNNQQREEYFRKTIKNPALAERVITYIKASKTLYIMCHLPQFCWLASKVLQQRFQCLTPSGKLPITLTNLYTSLLHLHTQMCTQKLQNCQAEETKGLTPVQLLIKLAKMAYSMLEKDQFKIEKEYWEEIELNDSYPAVVCSGLCSEYYREKFVMYTERVSCFAHPTIQEYLAAVHVFFCFKKHGKNVLEPNKFSKKVLKVSLVELLKSAVDRVLTSKNNNWDIFLRFLMGLPVEANQELLRDLLQISTGSTLQHREEISRYIQKKIKENHYPDKHETLLRCIDELNPQL